MQTTRRPSPPAAAFATRGLGVMSGSLSSKSFAFSFLDGLVLAASAPPVQGVGERSISTTPEIKNGVRLCYVKKTTIELKKKIARGKKITRWNTELCTE